MAEAARQEKLAAARKKLKKFQGKTTKPISSLLPNPALETLQTAIETSNSTNYSQIEPPPESNLATEVSIIDDSSSSKSSISSTESIRQISLQLNGLMSETHNFINGAIDVEPSNSSSELEKRNLELAASIEKHAQTNEHTLSQNRELKNQNSKLRQDLQKQREEIEERHFKELGSLKEQLQVHIQTIGILVAEKTELQSSLNQSQQSAKQKAAEAEEFQGRLKASRQRVVDIEKDLASTQTTSQQFEKSSKEFSNEVDRLKIEIYKTNKRMDELQQENSELSEKLNTRHVQSQSLQEQLESTKSSLAMAELRLQQLSGSDENKQFWEELSEEKIQLEKKVNQMKDTIRKLSQERDSVCEQHQLFAQQINHQMQNLSEKFLSVNEEKSALANEKLMLTNRINSLENEITELNKQLYKNPVENEETDRLQSMLLMAEDEKLRLQEQHDRDVLDNAHLSRLTEELDRKIEELESRLVDTKDDDAERKQLLEVLESDKVAASRAVTQNRELKKQLEELQNGFIVMSNNKLELVEKLESEQHIAKELSERLTQQEDELKELRLQLENRDREHNSTEINKQMYQQQQLVDRVRHYEAQSHLTELLQRELSQTQDRLNVLTTQNSELRTLLTQQGQQRIVANGKNTDDKDSSRKDDMMASLSASVCQLEMERDALLTQLGQQQGQREVFRAQLKEMKDNNLHQVNSEDGKTVSSSEYENMKDVLSRLEERFKKTMQEIAVLSDQKQELEHLVTQLQGETDTIGEYIALYQVQRGVMKQKSLEKDEYIADLARDREDMKTKLAKLQELVMRLLYERQQYSNGGQSVQHPPGKAIPSSESDLALKMTALNDADSLPNWADLDDDFNEINPLVGKEQKVVQNANVENNKDTTAKKIMDLISEIGSSSSIEKHGADNFHPCPVCSGKLMIV
uniref:Golgin subfamily A conserved domain-containing protein n=1 Tax=Strigamia maritima TaxID=126957 RepID=T1IVN4_STRMM